MMMKDDASYYKNAASVRRKQKEEDDYIDWGFEIWSANSSDLNLIENLWHILRSNIRKRKHQPRNKKELIEALMEEWKKLNIDSVNHLCMSMPRRLQAVIDSKGGLTKY